MHAQQKSHIARHNTRHRYYQVIAVIFTSAAIFLIGIWTYGYNKQSIVNDVRGVSRYQHDIAQTTNAPLPSSRHLSLALPQLPQEAVIKKILNHTMPITCAQCDQQPLECLRAYRIDQRVLQNAQNTYLALDVKTGSQENPHIYTVVIDLRNHNALIRHGGEVAPNACRISKKTRTIPQLFRAGSDMNHAAINMAH